MTMTQEKKAELFEAVAPQKSGPMIISTTLKKTIFGKVGGFFAFFFFAAVATLGYLYWQYDFVPKNELLNTTAAESSPIQRAEKLIMLPSNEKPVISTDESGNYVLSYFAYDVVYNQEKNIIVEIRQSNTIEPSAATASGSQVAGVEMSTSSISSIPEFQNTSPITLEIRNGSGVAGAAAKARDSMKDLTGYSVTAIGNASKSNHNTTIIVSLTGRNVEALEKRYNTIAITKLPTEELQSQADAVIVLGK